MQDDSLLVARHATRRFGYRTIVRDVNLTVSRGDVIVVLGPNGAGKTTLLKMLAGLTRPDEGTIERRGSVYAVMHETLLYDTLTGRENLTFTARLRGTVDTPRINQLLETVGLTRWADQRVLTYSRGMKQRLALARALLNDPDVFLLDEPLNSLDDQGCALVFDLLGEMNGRKRAAIVVTHQVGGFLSVCSSVGFLVGGRFHGPISAGGLTEAGLTTRYRELTASA